MQPKQIRISADKNGRELAHAWSVRAMRYIRMPLEQAKLEIATGAAVKIKAVAQSHPGWCDTRNSGWECNCDFGETIQ